MCVGESNSMKEIIKLSICSLSHFSKNSSKTKVMSSTKINSPNETPTEGCQPRQRVNSDQARSVVTKIEVVNEIQSVGGVGEKRIALTLPKATSSGGCSGNSGGCDNNSDLTKCLSSRNSKTNLTAVTTPSTLETATTTTLKTTKHVTIQGDNRRTSRERDRADNTNMCGKLLKRVKNMLEKKDIKSGECCVAAAVNL